MYIFILRGMHALIALLLCSINPDNNSDFHCSRQHCYLILITTFTIAIEQSKASNKPPCLTALTNQARGICRESICTWSAVALACASALPYAMLHLHITRFLPPSCIGSLSLSLSLGQLWPQICFYHAVQRQRQLPHHYSPSVWSERERDESDT